MGDYDRVEIEASIIRETEKAWLLDDGSRQSWVPKSQYEDNGDGTFTLPQWLAERCEFV